MKRQLLVAEFLRTPWALMPEHINAGVAFLARWQSGAVASAEVMAKVATDRQVREAKQANNTQVAGGAIAVLPFYGVVTQRPVEDLCGPGSLGIQGFTAMFRDALADDTIGAILIDIDSPGGSVYGTAELAEEIYQARGKKSVVAVANSLAASAAYWVGSAASEFYCTPGGEVGSIGVWQAHWDYSQMLAEEGIKPTLISAGKFKVEGNPYQPLDAEAQDFMQSRINDYYQAFTKGVARGRNVGIAQVRDGMGQGRCLGADAALAEKMIDGVMTFDDVLKKMQRNLRSSRNTSSAGRNSRAAAALQLTNLG